MEGDTIIHIKFKDKETFEIFKKECPNVIETFIFNKAKCYSINDCSIRPDICESYFKFIKERCVNKCLGLSISTDYDVDPFYDIYLYAGGNEYHHKYYEIEGDEESFETTEQFFEDLRYSISELQDIKKWMCRPFNELDSKEIEYIKSFNSRRRK